MKRLYAVIFWLILCCNAFATDYYVDPAATGSNDGSSWTNAWKNPQSAFDTVTAGNTCYMRGTYTYTSSTATIDIDTNSGGNSTGYIKFIGCNSSGNVDGTRFVFDINNQLVNGITVVANYQMIWFQNIEVKRAGTGKSGIFVGNPTAGWVFINCSFNNCASMGISAGAGFGSSTFYRCAFYNNSNGLYLSSNTAILAFSSFHDNTNYGIGYLGGVLYNSLVYDNVYGSSTTALSAKIIGSVIDSNTSYGISYGAGTSTNASVVFGSRITNHSGSGDKGIDANSEPLTTGYSYFENNDGYNIQNASLHYFIPNADGTTTNLEDQSNTNQGYTDLSSTPPNFNLRSDASLRRVAVSIPTE